MTNYNDERQSATEPMDHMERTEVDRRKELDSPKVINAQRAEIAGLKKTAAERDRNALKASLRQQATMAQERDGLLEEIQRAQKEWAEQNTTIGQLRRGVKQYQDQSDDQYRELCEVRAAAARRIVFLRKLEWSHSTYGGSFCYICQEWRRDGHKDDCALAAELRLAESEPLYVPSDTEERRVR